MGPVAVVTDSTCYLPPEFAAGAGVSVVPLTVVVDGRALAEGSEASADEVAAALLAHRRVSTSRPPAPAFRAAYAAAVAGGAGGIVAVHLSGGLSSTVDAARAAAADLPVPVAVVDSGTTAMGLGFAALAAAQAARGGADVAAVAGVAKRTAAASTVLFCVDTLEYLRRGGRLGPAAALLGTALSIKPILRISDGGLALVEKVRTPSRALARLGELALASATVPVDLAVHHVAAPERAAALAARLRAEVAELRALYVTELGATIAAHTGPGAVGVVVRRLD